MVCRAVQWYDASLCLICAEIHVVEDEQSSVKRSNRKRKAIDKLNYEGAGMFRGKVRIRQSELTVVDDGNVEMYEQRIRLVAFI